MAASTTTGGGSKRKGRSIYLPLVIVFYHFIVSSFDLGDHQKRWVVIGVTLNRLLLPVLRDFTSREISKHYASLKSSSAVDTQVYPTYVKNDGSFNFNYGSINNNWGRFKKKKRFYDYTVSTAEDLGKLYLEPHMAKFTGLKSGYCSLLARIGRHFK